MRLLGFYDIDKCGIGFNCLVKRKIKNAIFCKYNTEKSGMHVHSLSLLLRFVLLSLLDSVSTSPEHLEAGIVATFALRNSSSSDFFLHSILSSFTIDFQLHLGLNF